jgi:hypothetical protein
MSEYTQYLKISSSDGKNVVESTINDLRKRAEKGKVEFGVDIRIERIEEPSEHTEGFDNE